MFAPRRLDDRVSVAPQIAPDDLAAIAAAGFAGIINNRPDDEEAGQPTGEAIHIAAEAAGLAYVAVPVAGSIDRGAVEAMAAAIAAADGPVLAFCRSGTRSAHLWALATASAGGDVDGIVRGAADAGYAVTGLRPALDALAARR